MLFRFWYSSMCRDAVLLPVGSIHPHVPGRDAVLLPVGSFYPHVPGHNLQNTTSSLESVLISWLWHYIHFLSNPLHTISLCKHFLRDVLYAILSLHQTIIGFVERKEGQGGYCLHFASPLWIQYTLTTLPFLAGAMNSAWLMEYRICLLSDRLIK